jgi:hypothetical protein
MNKYFVAIACMVLSMFFPQNIIAQSVTKYGDNVATLDGIMKAYYDVVTVKKGEKVRYERDSLLHVAGAQVGWNQQGKDGKPHLKMVSLKEYHRMSDEHLEKNGFYEIEISRKVENFGSIYHVFSTYETRNTYDGPIIGRGINSIELFFDGTRFWIITWVFDDERKDNPIPSEYLTK